MSPSVQGGKNAAGRTSPPYRLLSIFVKFKTNEPPFYLWRTVHAFYKVVLTRHIPIYLCWDIPLVTIGRTIPTGTARLDLLEIYT